MADQTGQRAVERAIATSDAAPLQGELLPAAASAVPQRGRGRPAGSLNKRDLELVDRCAARHGMYPYEALAADLARLQPLDGETLQANAVRCGFEDAAGLIAERRAIATAMAPFAHQRRPQAIEITPLAGASMDELAEIDGDYTIAGGDQP